MPDEKSSDPRITAENITAKPSVTVLGLGPMGSAIARALDEGGYRVTVWNRTPAKAAALPASIRRADTARNAVLASDLVVISLVDGKAAREVVSQAAGAFWQRVVVNLSSDTPSTSMRLAEDLVSLGARALSGVMSTPSTVVGTPASAMLIAGDERLWAATKPMLDAFAPASSWVGVDLDRPATLDMVLLDAFWLSYGAWAHAVAMGRSHGLTSADLDDRLQGMLRLVADIGPSISQAADSGDFTATVSTARSARVTLEHIVHTAALRGVDTTMPTMLLEHFRTVEQRGHSEASPSAVVDVLRD